MDISDKIKLVVPLIMPANQLILLATSPSLILFKTGIPPPTDASKATFTLAFLAASKIMDPNSAISALLAVTTCFLFDIASITSSKATSVPPINSATKSTLGSLAT